MFVTAEVRWFYEGPPPDAVAAWFQGLGPPVDEQDPRTDYYLRPTDEALNVKLREGQAEAKRRDGTVGALVSLADGQAGMVEHWRKWSFPLASEALGSPPADAYWMRAYRLAEDAIDEDTETSSEAARRCECELSELTIKDQTWWSLCLEASGDEPEDSLRRTATHIFGPTAPSLHADASMGYPAWLLRVTR